MYPLTEGNRPDYSFWSTRITRRTALKAVPALALGTEIAASVTLDEFSPSRHIRLIDRVVAAQMGEILTPLNAIPVAHNAGESDDQVENAARANVHVEEDINKVNNVLCNDHKGYFTLPIVNFVVGGADVKPLRVRPGPPIRTVERGLDAVEFFQINGVMFDWKSNRGQFTGSDVFKIASIGKSLRIDIRHVTNNEQVLRMILSHVDDSRKLAFYIDPRHEATDWARYYNLANSLPKNRRPAVSAKVDSLLAQHATPEWLGTTCFVNDMYTVEQAEQLVESNLDAVVIVNETENLVRMNLTSRKPGPNSTHLPLL